MSEAMGHNAMAPGGVRADIVLAIDKRITVRAVQKGWLVQFGSTPSGNAIVGEVHPTRGNVNGKVAGSEQEGSTDVELCKIRLWFSRGCAVEGVDQQGRSAFQPSSVDISTLVPARNCCVQRDIDRSGVGKGRGCVGAGRMGSAV
jgi:hypothetical protein